MIQYTSSKEIISKLYRELNLQSEDRVYAILEFIGEALEFINVFPQCQKVEVTGGISDYKLPLPYNCREVLDVCTVDRVFHYTYDSSLTFQVPTTLVEEETDKYRYQESNGMLHFPYKSGVVLVTFSALPLDEDGFPLIPDNISVKEAITKYCVKKLKYTDWLAGRINDNTFAKIEGDWNFYCKQARASLITPNVDKMDELITLWKSIIPNVRAKDIQKPVSFPKFTIDPRTVPSMNIVQ